MSFYKLLRGGCGTAVGILAIHRYKSEASPVGAAEVQPRPSNVLEVNPKPCNTKESLEAKWDCNWDKKAKLKSGALRHIIFIRHGHYDGTFVDLEKKSLTQLGREQAALTGKRLQELGLPYTSIIYSTMTRARETAEIIASYFPDVPVSANNVLEEGSPIQPEPPLTGFVQDPLLHYADGPRIEGAFRQLFYRSSSDQCDESFDIVVCHGNVIRYCVCRALQFPPEGFLRMSLNHCSITWMTVVSDGRVVMQSYNESSFMPPEKITGVSPGQK